MGEKLREVNPDVLAEMRAINEGMTGDVKPLPTPRFEIRLAQIEQSRATDEGMPEPIIMEPGVAIKLPKNS